MYWILKKGKANKSFFINKMVGKLIAIKFSIGIKK